jgi:hypothetical protein
MAAVLLRYFVCDYVSFIPYLRFREVYSGQRKGKVV